MQNGISRTGMTRRDRQNRKDIIGQAEQERQNGGQAEQERQNGIG
jgi:hypothetical protein